MSDHEPIVGENIPQPTEPEKPKRQRRQRAQETVIDFTVGSEKAEPKKSSPRRAKKITGGQVTEGVVKLSGLTAMLMQEELCLVSAEEVAPWAAEAANLLNAIPGKYVDGVISLSGYATVLFGIYSIVSPRRELIAQKRAAATAARNGSTGGNVGENVAAEWAALSVN